MIRDIVFPFQVANGVAKVTDGLGSLRERVKRVIYYAVSDLPFDTGIGSGANEFVFAPDLSVSMQSFIRKRIVASLVAIDGIEKANVAFAKESTGMRMHVLYQVEGRQEFETYTHENVEV